MTSQATFHILPPPPDTLRGAWFCNFSPHKCVSSHPWVRKWENKLASDYTVNNSPSTIRNYIKKFLWIFRWKLQWIQALKLDEPDQDELRQVWELCVRRATCEPRWGRRVGGPQRGHCYQYLPQNGKMYLAEIRWAPKQLFTSDKTVILRNNPKMSHNRVEERKGLSLCHQNAELSNLKTPFDHY